MQLSKSRDPPNTEHTGVVWKLSNLQMFFHERYLVLKEGTLAYYRRRPQTGVQATPKSKQLLSACKVGPVSPEFARKKSRKFMFQVAFKVPGKSKLKNWIFATIDQETLSRWVKTSQLETLYNAQNPQAIQELFVEDEPQLSASEEFKFDDTELEQERLEQERIDNEKRQHELEKRKARQRQKEQEEQRRKDEIEENLKRLREEEEKHKKA
jgi:hypothetical protein